jgi:tetratricopeptide (TPR) repeat protein
MSLKRDYLEKAKRDGHECFMCMPTRRDMTILAEICQTLAKFPDTYAHGPESLTSKKDMFDALDYMHYANNLGEPTDNYSAYRMASCLFDLGEYEKAVEWQQRALFLAGDRSSSSFFMLCIFMLALTGGKCIDKNVVTRFVSFLIIGKRQGLWSVCIGIGKLSKGLTYFSQNSHIFSCWHAHKTFMAVLFCFF